MISESRSEGGDWGLEEGNSLGTLCLSLRGHFKTLSVDRPILRRANKLEDEISHQV